MSKEKKRAKTRILECTTAEMGKRQDQRRKESYARREKSVAEYYGI